MTVAASIVRVYFLTSAGSLKWWWISSRRFLTSNMLTGTISSWTVAM